MNGMDGKYQPRQIPPTPGILRRAHVPLYSCAQFLNQPRSFIFVAFVVHFSELMLKFALTLEKQKGLLLFTAVGSRQLQSCALWLHLFILCSHPAVHPDQDPELCYHKRALAKPAALNIRTLGKKKEFIWTSLVTGCLDKYYSVSLCQMPDIFEGLKERRFTLAYF